MNTNKTIVCGLFAVLLALAFAACDDGNGNNPAHQHQWGAWMLTTASTCTTAGVETRVCDLNSAHTETRPVAINRNAHRWGAWTVTTPATDTTDGLKTRTCAYNPAHIETEIIVALNHTHVWGAWIQTRTPTATEPGEETRVCTLNPAHTETRPIPATGGGNPLHTHVWGNWGVTRAPTETQDGEETRTCATCGETQTRAIATLSHTHVWGDWEQTTVPTCTTASEDTRVCLLNPAHTETRTGVINPNGHNFDSWIPMTPSTCTSTGTETGICAYNTTHTTMRSTSINPDAHDWNTAYTTISFATVTENGIEAITCKYNASHTKEPHIYAYATGTPGLAFEAIGSPAYAYRVSAGSVTGGAVHIPAYYRPNANSAYQPVTEIGEEAFFETGITSITIPASVTTIGDAAVEDCTNLTSITVDDANQNYASQDGILYNKAKTKLIQCPGGKSGAVTIPASVTTFGESAFWNCTSLTSITIPEGVTSIGNAFENCLSLTSITIPASVTSIGQYAFYNTAWLNNQPNGLVYAGKVLYTYKGTMPANTVINNIRSDTTGIAEAAFESCTGLTSITIPAGVITIDRRAFLFCTSLTSITTLYALLTPCYALLL